LWYVYEKYSSIYLLDTYIILIFQDIFTNKEIRERYKLNISEKKLSKVRAGIEPKKVGRKPLSPEIKDAIIKFVQEQSTPAANRSITIKDNQGKKTQVPVSYLPSSVRGTFIEFKRVHPDTEVAESAFRKCIPPHIKRARKATDLCDHCEMGASVERAQKRMKSTGKLSCYAIYIIELM